MPQNSEFVRAGGDPDGTYINLRDIDGDGLEVSLSFKGLRGLGGVSHPSCHRGRISSRVRTRLQSFTTAARITRPTVAGRDASKALAAVAREAMVMVLTS